LLSWACEYTDRSVPFGKYCRSRPLVFSLEPRCLDFADRRSKRRCWSPTSSVDDPRAGITERMSDYITGHAQKSTGAGYGAPILSDMADALKRFPRYEV
jgi:hypothetical protein